MEMQAAQKYEKIWNRFLKILESEAGLTSQAEVARKLGVNTGQVSKWISGYSCGANLKTFLSVLDTFKVPYQQVFIDEPIEYIQNRSHEVNLKESLPEAFDKALAKELEEALLDAEMTERDISMRTNISRNTLRDILNGDRAILARHLQEICAAIDHNPKILLNRAARKSKDTQQTRKSA